jgi:hypothetical protein
LRIDLKLDAKSIGDALKMLQDYEQKCSSRADEACSQLAEYAALQLEQAYAGSGYVGEDAVIIDIDPIENGYSVKATTDTFRTAKESGLTVNAIYFREFGAGDDAASAYGPGSWSAQDAHMYEKHGYWVHNGEKFTTQPAAMAFPQAKEAVRQVAPRFVREEFSDV